MADGNSCGNGDSLQNRVPENQQGEQSRVPENMQGLLRFCIEATKTEDAPNQISDFSAMSPEKREWLSKALEGMSTSPVQEMMKCISGVKEADESSGKEVTAEVVTHACSSLEELHEWCEHIDFAVDFHKIGGFSILPMVFNHRENNIRWRGLELVALLVQNNPYCQNAIIELDLLQDLLRILDTDTDSTVRTKALYAISCLLRDSDAAQEDFMKHDGFSVLLRAMQSDIEKVKVKAAFLLRSILGENCKYKETLCQMGMVEQLLGHLMQDHHQEHEHVMAALLCLVRNHPSAISECRRSELNMPTFLRNRLDALTGKEEHQCWSDEVTCFNIFLAKWEVWFQDSLCTQHWLYAVNDREAIFFSPCLSLFEFISRGWRDSILVPQGHDNFCIHRHDNTPHRTTHLVMLNVIGFFRHHSNQESSDNYQGWQHATRTQIFPHSESEMVLRTCRFSLSGDATIASYLHFEVPLMSDV